MSEARAYRLCGWRVQSEVELPELMPAAGDGEDVDVAISVGAIELPAAPGAAGREGGDGRVGTHLRVLGASRGTVLFSVPDVARFLVVEGRHVTIEPCAEASWSVIRTYLLGTVLAILCHQRGLVPLHASCLAIGDVAVAITGRRGAGKSTTAMALARLGFDVLADDVCVVDLAEPAGPLVLPSVARIKLWRDAHERLDLPIDPALRIRDGHEKFGNATARFRSQPAPLRRLFVLSKSGEDEAPLPTPALIRGIDALHASRAAVYRRFVARAIGKERVLDRNAMKIVEHARVYAITRADDEDPYRLADRILESLKNPA